ncbi:hypothetical protein GJAV_G00084050 [Gymnothorax javanicus]|nr:hypothetical protein GJAV_G00084050 [Gymnothorax javanicus]
MLDSCQPPSKNGKTLMKKIFALIRLKLRQAMQQALRERIVSHGLSSAKSWGECLSCALTLPQVPGTQGGPTSKLTQ